MPLPSYKDIVDLIKKGATFEAQEKIMELREAVMELQEENLSLREQVTHLRSEIAKKEELEFDGAIYWKKDSDGRRIGPYCQKCFDADGKLIRLQDYQDRWYCLHCKTSQGYR